MEQFDVVDDMVLSTIEGGDGGASLLWFLVGGFIHTMLMKLRLAVGKILNNGTVLILNNRKAHK
ncbi:Blp family class II bacteriocin [Streptococcus pluranimalium]